MPRADESWLESNVEAVILIGVPAAGKSTFYRERFFRTHVRINLDMLRTRRRESTLLQACIQAKQSFVVDNTNVSIEDRARYIERAKSAGYRIVGYYFECSLEDAIRRNRQRPPEDRIPEVAIRARRNLLQRPRMCEGFDALHSVSTNARDEFVVCDWSEEV